MTPNEWQFVSSPNETTKEADRNLMAARPAGSPSAHFSVDLGLSKRGTPKYQLIIDTLW